MLVDCHPMTQDAQWLVLSVRLSRQNSPRKSCMSCQALKHDVLERCVLLCMKTMLNYRTGTQKRECRLMPTLTFDLLTANKMVDQDLSCTIHCLPRLSAWVINWMQCILSCFSVLFTIDTVDEPVLRCPLCPVFWLQLKPVTSWKVKHILLIFLSHCRHLKNLTSVELWWSCQDSSGCGWHTLTNGLVRLECARLTYLTCWWNFSLWVNWIIVMVMIDVLHIHFVHKEGTPYIMSLV